MPTVNAEDLHMFLGVGRKVSTWINERISKYGFAERIDFIVKKGLGQNRAKPQGGRPGNHYFITLDMAKQISMVDTGPKGQEARQYFIQQERLVQELEAEKRQGFALPTSLPEALQLAADQAKENQRYHAPLTRAARFSAAT